MKPSLLAGLKARLELLKAEVIAVYLAAKHPLTPWYAKLFMLAIVAYALSPIDLIPDFIPVIGFLDDLLLLPLGIALAIRMVPAAVMAECRARASAQVLEGTGLGRTGAIAVALVWIVLAVLAAIWARDAFASRPA